MLYVNDYANGMIRTISSGTVSTLAGGLNIFAYADGQGSAAQFFGSQRSVVDFLGNIYVSDHDNHVIRKITPAGLVSTFAGKGPAFPGCTNGQGKSATFYFTAGLAIDSSNNIYVADAQNAVIRKITADGFGSTLSGYPGASGYAEGVGSAARFNQPMGVAVDAAGNVFVSDSWNGVLRKITPSGQTSLVAGVPGFGGFVEGLGTVAKFNNPIDVAIDTNGVLYVSDRGNLRIRKIALRKTCVATCV